MVRLRYLILAASLLPASAAPAQDVTTWQGKTATEWTRQLGQLDLQDIRGRWYATYALGQLGPDAVEAVGPLQKVLENRADEHEYVRGNAAWALGRIGPRAKAAVPLLIETLQSQLMSVRRNASEALGMIGAEAEPAVDGLTRLLEDKDSEVRVNAAVALWRINKHAKAVPALRDMLARGQGPAPYLAASALGQIGAETEDALSPLAAALGHADADVRRAAARALGQIGPKAVPVIKQALSSPSEEARRGAVEALGWMGSLAVPELIAALKNDRPAARRAAARALGRLGAEAKLGESALLEAVDDSDPNVRATAADALRKVRGE
jgi:HEAT repeat protein